MIQRILFLLTLTVMIAGCAPQSSPGQNSQETSTATTVPQASEVGSADDLMNQLRASGAAVEPAGSVEQPFFNVPGQRFLVNGQDVQVFAFESEEARQAASSQISKDGSSIGTTMVSWVEPPHFWAKEKLIALYVGNNQEVVDLVNKVLGPSITQP